MTPPSNTVLHNLATQLRIELEMLARNRRGHGAGPRQQPFREGHVEMEIDRFPDGVARCLTEKRRGHLEQIRLHGQSLVMTTVPESGPH